MLKDQPTPDKIREARRRLPAHQLGFCEVMPGSETLEFLVIRQSGMTFHLQLNRQTNNSRLLVFIIPKRREKIVFKFGSVEFPHK
jgi:hypothetical protein